MSWQPDSGFRFPREFEQLDREGRFGLSRSDAAYRWTIFMGLDGAAIFAYNMILLGTGHLGWGNNVVLDLIKYGVDGIGIGAFLLANMYRKANNNMANGSRRLFDNMHRNL